MTHDQVELPPDALALQQFRRLQRLLVGQALGVVLIIVVVYLTTPVPRLAVAVALGLVVAMAEWLSGRLARRDLPTAALLSAAMMFAASIAAVAVHPAFGQAAAIAAMTGAAVAVAFLDGLRLRAALTTAAVLAGATTLISLTSPASPEVSDTAVHVIGGSATVACAVAIAFILLEWRRRLEGAADRYRRLYDDVPVGLVRTSTDGRILEANPALVSLLRFPDLATLLRTPVQHLYEEPAERTVVLGRVDAANDTQERETRVRRWDGSTAWIRTVTRVVRAPDGSILHYEAAAQDITEARRDALALAESQAALRLILDQLPAVLWTVDRDLRLQTADGAPLATLGVRTADLIGARVTDLVSRADAAGAVVAAHQKALAGTPASFDVRWSDLDLRAHVEPLRDEGDVIGVIGIALDVSDRVRLEAQLRQVHKMEAVGRLAGGIAHDFNNLLTAILGNAALALSELPPDHASRPEVEQIRAAAERAATLTGQLLAFGRRQLTRPEPVDLQSVVDGLEPLLRRLLGEHIRIVFDRPAVHPIVLGDASQLEQVVLNLALNARDAMPAGGALTIATGAAELDASFAWEHPGAHTGRYARLSVSDTGTGIDASVREHLFEPFFSTKDVGHGTGLGLSTVYGIVKQSQGYIDVRSEPGEGSTFDVYIPLSRNAAEDQASAALGEAARGGHGTILLVEDEVLVRHLAERVLRAEGYQVTVAGNGSEALIQATALPQLDILVTDIVMPGMSGLELADRLGPEHPDLTVLFMTGYPGDQDGQNDQGHPSAQGSWPAPGRAVLPKPFTPDGLLAAVRAAVASGPRMPRSAGL